MRHWRPDLELELLLQALEQEILAAEEEEPRLALARTGVSLDLIQREVRCIVRSALEEYDDPLADSLQAPLDLPGDNRLRRPH